jgi:5,10-methylenetetrahydromethanopterin reductase
MSAPRFRGKHIGLALWGSEPVPTLVRTAQLAEQIGIDSIWVIDSQLLCREVMVTLAACLAQTTRLRVATGVTQPATRHPSVTASAMATLHEMSNSRAIMGIGTGFSSLRTIGLGSARIAEVEDYVSLVRRLLRGEAVRFGDTDAAIAWLDRPAQVPIVIAASAPRMTRTAARIADGVIVHQGLSDDLLARALGWVGEGAASAGRDAAELEVSCWVPYSMASDPLLARDRVRARVAGGLMQANPDWFTGAERDAVVRLQQSYQVGDHASANPHHAALVPDSLVDRYAVAGTPDEVGAQLTRLLDRPAIDRVIINPQVTGPGALPIDQVLHELEQQVLRRL